MAVERLRQEKAKIKATHLRTLFADGLFLLPQHLLDHLKVLGHCVPGHLSPLGNGAVIRLVGTEPHVLPDLPLLLGEFLRRWDSSQPVQDCLPLGVQLLDEYLQLLLTLLPGMGVDTFGVLGAVRPGG